MNFRVAAKAAFPLILSLSAFAPAQTSTTITPPPVKIGLWQTSMTIAMSGLPSGAPSGHTVARQSCMTPDSWKKDLGRMNQQQKAECTMSNVQQDSHHLLLDETCSTSQGNNVTVHAEFLFDSDESMHGTSTAKLTGPTFPQGMTVSSTINSKYLGSDCGDIKPGDSKTVQQ